MHAAARFVAAASPATSGSGSDTRSHDARPGSDARGGHGAVPCMAIKLTSPHLHGGITSGEKAGFFQMRPCIAHDVLYQISRQSAVRDADACNSVIACLCQPRAGMMLHEFAVGSFLSVDAYLAAPRWRSGQFPGGDVRLLGAGRGWASAVRRISLVRPGSISLMMSCGRGKVSVRWPGFWGPSPSASAAVLPYVQLHWPCRAE
jgi:hypothetical protein